MLIILLTMSLLSPMIASSKTECNEKTILYTSDIKTLDTYDIKITTPEEGNLYAIGAQFFRLPFNWTVIFGPITIRASVNATDDFSVKFYVDDVLQTTDDIYPYEYAWWTTSFGKKVIKVELYYEDILRDNDSIDVFKIL